MDKVTEFTPTQPESSNESTVQNQTVGSRSNEQAILPIDELLRHMNEVTRRVRTPDSEIDWVEESARGRADSALTGVGREDSDGQWPTTSSEERSEYEPASQSSRDQQLLYHLQQASEEMERQRAEIVQKSGKTQADKLSLPLGPVPSSDSKLEDRMGPAQPEEGVYGIETTVQPHLTEEVSEAVTTDVAETIVQDNAVQKALSPSNLGLLQHLNEASAEVDAFKRLKLGAKDGDSKSFRSILTAGTGRIFWRGATWAGSTDLTTNSGFGVGQPRTEGKTRVREGGSKSLPKKSGGDRKRVLSISAGLVSAASSSSIGSSSAGGLRSAFGSSNARDKDASTS